jgi:uncharacterized protein (DUF488 family)
MMTTRQRPTIYTAGYAAPGWTPEGLRAEAVRLGALVVDVRLFPRSQRAGWAGAALEPVLGEHYVHVPELGNRNYRSRGGPIQIADPQGGVARVAPLLVERSVILLCRCPQVETCHRRIVAALVQAAMEAPIVHLEPPG